MNKTNPTSGAARPNPPERCIVCGSATFKRLFEHAGADICACAGCGLQVRTPQPSDIELERIYSGEYFLGSTDPEFVQDAQRLKHLTAARYLDVVERVGGILPADSTRLFEIGCGTGAFLQEGQRRGFDVRGSDVSSSAVVTVNERLGEQHAVSGDILDLTIPPMPADVCAASGVIEHTRDPGRFLGAVQRLVKLEGLVFITTMSLDSWSAKLLGRHWVEFKPEHLLYFGEETLRRLLLAKGFTDVHILAGTKILSLDYITEHFVRFPLTGVTPLPKARAECCRDACSVLPFPSWRAVCAR